MNCVLCVNLRNIQWILLQSTYELINVQNDFHLCPFLYCCNGCLESFLCCWYVSMVLSSNMECGFFAEISIAPSSKNTTLGSTVNFTCGAVADFIHFFVNGNPTPFPIGFQQLPLEPVDLVAGLWKRVLIVTALSSTNNSNITCTVTTLTPLQSNHSDITVVIVQGNQAIWHWIVHIYTYI